MLVTLISTSLIHFACLEFKKKTIKPIVLLGQLLKEADSVALEAI